MEQQKGTIGKLVYDPSFYNSAKSLMDKGNTLLDGVNEGKGTLGKLVHDDALYTNLRDASANVREATGKLNSNQGTHRKIFHRSGLLRQLHRAVGRHAADGERLPAEPEEIPAREVGNFLEVADRGAAQAVIALGMD